MWRPLFLAMKANASCQRSSEVANLNLIGVLSSIVLWNGVEQKKLAESGTAFSTKRKG